MVVCVCDGIGNSGAAGAAAGRGAGALTAACDGALGRTPAISLSPAMMPAMSACGLRAVSSCSTSSGTAATDWRSSVIISGLRSSVLLMTRLSRFSTAHANSPMSCAPTMRPLPFSVWNERRTLTSESWSCGFSSHSGNRRLSLVISSFASSMNSSRNSGSISRSTGFGAGAALAAGLAGAGFCRTTVAGSSTAVGSCSVGARVGEAIVCDSGSITTVRA